MPHYFCNIYFSQPLSLLSRFQPTLPSSYVFLPSSSSPPLFPSPHPLYVSPFFLPSIPSLSHHLFSSPSTSPFFLPFLPLHAFLLSTSAVLSSSPLLLPYRLPFSPTFPPGFPFCLPLVFPALLLPFPLPFSSSALLISLILPVPSLFTMALTLVGPWWSWRHPLGMSISVSNYQT